MDVTAYILLLLHLVSIRCFLGVIYPALSTSTNDFDLLDEALKPIGRRVPYSGRGRVCMSPGCVSVSRISSGRECITLFPYVKDGGMGESMGEEGGRERDMDNACGHTLQRGVSLGRR